MDVAGIYEMLGRTYAMLCDTAEKEGYWRNKYEKSKKKLDEMTVLNERLRKELQRYEAMAGNDGNFSNLR